MAEAAPLAHIEVDPNDLRIGVLSLQGNFAVHSEQLASLGVAVVPVRRAEQLANLAGLVIPGGESTTLLRLLDSDLRNEIVRAAQSNLPILATCAGLILLAKRVNDPSQDSLGVLDLTVSRNAFGRQIDSFIDKELNWSEEGVMLAKSYLGFDEPPSQEGVFIRAPRIESIKDNVQPILRLGTETVLVRQGSILGATFHPELAAGENVVHQLFVAMAKEYANRFSK